MKKMKCFISGGSGFIGSRLIETLKKEKDLELVNYDLVNGDDIRDEFKLNSVFEKNKFDVVIHLAARAGIRTGEDYPNEFMTTNVIGTNNIVRMCQKHKVNKLIFYSSSSVLGGNKEIAGKLLPLTEESEYQCDSLYAQTKMFGEYLVKQSGLNYIIIRPFTVYGENGRGDMVMYKWINQVKKGEPITFYGDGKTSRGYTYVQDLVDGTISFLKAESLNNETVNLGGVEVIELGKLLKILGDVCRSKKIELEIDRQEKPKADVSHSFADVSKAEKLIGYSPNSKFYDIVKSIFKKEL